MSVRFSSLAAARRALGDRAIARIPESELKAIKKRAPNLTPLGISVPHQKLWDAVVVEFASSGPLLEFQGAVPDRRFRIDIAFPNQKLAIEVDGHKHHGRHRAGFYKDREKQNLLVKNGWRVLRFAASVINNELEKVMVDIKDALENTLGNE